MKKFSVISPKKKVSISSTLSGIEESVVISTTLYGADPPPELGEEAPSPSSSPSPEEPEQRPLSAKTNSEVNGEIENIMDGKIGATKDHDAVPKNDRDDAHGEEEGDHDTADGERFSDAPTEPYFPAQIFGMFIMRSNTASPASFSSVASTPKHGSRFAQFLVNDFRPLSPLDRPPSNKSPPVPAESLPGGGSSSTELGEMRKGTTPGKDPPKKPNKKVIEGLHPQSQHPWVWTSRFCDDQPSRAGGHTREGEAPVPVGYVCVLREPPPGRMSGVSLMKKEDESRTETSSPSTTMVRTIAVAKKPTYLRPPSAAASPAARPQVALSSEGNRGGGETGEAATQMGSNGKTLSRTAVPAPVAKHNCFGKQAALDSPARRAGAKEVGISSERTNNAPRCRSLTGRRRSSTPVKHDVEVVLLFGRF